MHLAGLKKSSLIDYPHKISCVLYLTGCNFSCPYCHNPDLALGKYPDRIHASRVSAFLKDRRELIDGVVITGGEPTLDPNLPKLCHTIKALGFAVKLDTNGSRPGVLARLIGDGIIDYIAMDIKTAIGAYGTPICRTALQPKIEQSIQLIMEDGLDYEFRTTCVRPFIDEPTMERIGRKIQGARRYWLQRFQVNSLLQADFFNNRPDCGYTPRQMQRLQRLAAAFVQRCDVR